MKESSNQSSAGSRTPSPEDSTKLSPTKASSPGGKISPGRDRVQASCKKLPQGLSVSIYPYSQDQMPVAKISGLKLTEVITNSLWSTINPEYLPDAVRVITPSVSQSAVGSARKQASRIQYISYMVPGHKVMQAYENQGVNKPSYIDPEKYYECCFSAPLSSEMMPQWNADTLATFLPAQGGITFTDEQVKILGKVKVSAWGSAAPSTSSPTKKSKGGANKSMSKTPGTRAYFREQDSTGLSLQSGTVYRLAQFQGEQVRQVQTPHHGEKRKVTLVQKDTRISKIEGAAAESDKAKTSTQVVWAVVDEEKLLNALKPPVPEPKPAQQPQAATPVQPKAPETDPSAPKHENDGQIDNQSRCSCSILPFLILLTLIDAGIIADQFSFKGGFHCRKDHHLMAVVAGAVLVLLVLAVAYYWNRPEVSHTEVVSMPADTGSKSSAN